MDGAVTKRLAKRALASWRGLGIAVLGLAGVAYFLRVVHAHYPIQHWLVWRHILSALLALLFTGACLTSGHLLVRRIAKGTLPVREHVVFAFAAGVLVFGNLVFLSGLVHWLTPLTFFALPVACLAAGGRSTFRYARRLMLHLAHRRRSSGGTMRTALHHAVFALGTLAVALAVFPILTPENVAYDARWYHLAMPEHYVAQGYIGRFEEGWFIGAYPQLVTYLYTWAFLWPKADLFSKVLLATYIELALFVMTLISIPALVRRLVPGRWPLSWVALFLFPGIYVYDATLSTSGDHPSALWTIPILLGLVRVLKHMNPANAALFAGAIAAALMTKYSGVILVAPFPVAAVLLVGLYRIVRGRNRREVLRSLATAAGVGLLVSAPHWLKNAIFYHNPLYPAAENLFPSIPWTGDCSVPLHGYFLIPGWRPPRTLDGLWETLKALAFFSFEPHNFPEFHGLVPVFGSLFTLTTPLLVFLRRSRRIWLVYVSAYVGIFAWYWIHHFDRYLQTITPGLAAGLAAVAILAWREGVLARVAVVALGAAQFLWSLDIPFIPAHSMSRDRSAYRSAADFLSQGYRKNYANRYRIYEPFVSLAALLPERSKVLLHEQHMSLGLGRPRIHDWPGTQGGITYHQFRTTAEVRRHLENMGATHVVWSGRSVALDSLAGDIAFYSFLRDEVRMLGGHGGLAAGVLKPEVTNRKLDGQVAILACSGVYSSGLYEFADLKTSAVDPGGAAAFAKPRAPLPAKKDGADYFVHDTTCKAERAPKDLSRRYEHLFDRGTFRVYRRNPP